MEVSLTLVKSPPKKRAFATTVSCASVFTLVREDSEEPMRWIHRHVRQMALNDDEGINPVFAPGSLKAMCQLAQIPTKIKRFRPN